MTTPRSRACAGCGTYLDTSDPDNYVEVKDKLYHRGCAPRRRRPVAVIPTGGKTREQMKAEARQALFPD
jgi:hypothetical protein